MHQMLRTAVALSVLAAGSVLADSPPPAPGAAPAPASPPQTANPNVDEAKSIVKTFAVTLKGELEAALKQGGPTKAIQVCKERAPAIAADVSAKSGWDVRRVSLKVRNAKLDTPDAWERAVLQRFDERRAAGESADTMAYSEVVETDGVRRFRFMKAIPTTDVCLACHGTQISPEVAAALDQAYPGDQARGFKPGDVRGAFTLSKPL